MAFYYPVCAKLREIFAEHCNLSMDQYEEISRMFLELVSDIQERLDSEWIEGRITEMGAIFEFLYNTKELSIGEYNDLCNMARKIQSRAEEEKRELVKKALQEGTVL